MMNSRPFIALTVLLAASVAGCAQAPRNPDDIQPLYLSYLHIYEAIEGGVAYSTYTGSLIYPYCVTSLNDFELTSTIGDELYQVDPVTQEMRLVENSTGPAYMYANGTNSADFGSHVVLANETAEGGTTYALHIWYEILNPEPIHYRDHWFNTTFTPFGQGTNYVEGKWADCRTGRPPPGEEP